MSIVMSFLVLHLTPSVDAFSVNIGLTHNYYLVTTRCGYTIKLIEISTLYLCIGEVGIRILFYENFNCVKGPNDI
jgi:hypothetical protein